jgi:hypothetical protein
MQSFTLHIKNKNKLIAKYGMLFNHLIAMLFFVSGIFLTDLWWKWVLLGVGIAGVTYFLINYKAIKQRFNYFDFIVLLFETVILVITTRYWAIPIISTVLQVYLFIEIRKATRFQFDNDRILLKGPFLNRKYGWDILDNVIVRDGLLTLDFKTNKFVQEEIDADKSKLDSLAFNAYCNKMLQTSAVSSETIEPIKADESFKI